MRRILLGIGMLSVLATACQDRPLPQRNAYRKQATQAFEAGNYEEAKEHLAFLQDSLGVSQGGRVDLNRAHTLYFIASTQSESASKLLAGVDSLSAEALQAKIASMDSAQMAEILSAPEYLDLARQAYEGLFDLEDEELRSIAYNQAGRYVTLKKPADTCLWYFKQAMLADPYNEAARFNYELVAVYLTQENDPSKPNDEESEEEQQDEEMKLSPYAMVLEQLARQMVQQRRYAEAKSLLDSGLEKDSTVSLLQDLNQKLGTVSEVEAKNSDL